MDHIDSKNGIQIEIYTDASKISTLSVFGHSTLSESHSKQWLIDDD